MLVDELQIRVHRCEGPVSISNFTSDLSARSCRVACHSGSLKHGKHVAHQASPCYCSLFSFLPDVEKMDTHWAARFDCIVSVPMNSGEASNFYFAKTR